MFGQNAITGRKYFTNQEGDRVNKLKVTSCFFTIQGEGPKRGHRCVFQRFTHCNLDCSFCDTFFDAGEWKSPDEMKDMAFAEIDNSDAENILLCGDSDNVRYNCGLVITGGEPMLQPMLGEYLLNMHNHFAWVQIETNGTQWQELPDQTIVVCSPKCVEKDGRPTKYLKPHKWLLQRANCLKFVMNSDPHSPYSEVPEWALDWLNDTPPDYLNIKREIFVSPMNIYRKQPIKTAEMSIAERSRVDEVISFWDNELLDRNANEANHKYAARYAMKHGFTFQVQEHLLAALA